MCLWQDLPFPDPLPGTPVPEPRREGSGGVGGEEKGEERQLSRPAAQRPGGSREPASIWTHQAKQLCWVPYVGGARIHDIRAHLVYNKPPFLSPPQSVFPLRSSTTCHLSGETGKTAPTFSPSHPTGSLATARDQGDPEPHPLLRPGPVPQGRRSKEPRSLASSLVSAGSRAVLRAPVLLFFLEHAEGVRL